MVFPIATSLLLLLNAPALQDGPQPRSERTATQSDKPAPDSPALADHTGIEWTFPFSAAVEKARKENRILMVKPIAFGTTRDGGW